VADDEHMFPDIGQTGYRRRFVPLLAPGDEVVHQHSETAAGAWTQFPDGVSEVVDAVQHFDDDTLDPQVVTPYFLDELGVVPAFDEDAGRPGRPRAGAVNGHRTARRPGASCWRGPGGGDETHGGTVDPETGAHREGLETSSPILKDDDVDAAALLGPDDGAHPPGLDVLDDQSELGVDVGQDPLG
jgi:hypothetical protein